MMRGTRVFNGRYYILNGRGTREEMLGRAAILRREWRYIRVVMYRGPRVLDDYCCYVFERRES